MKNRVARLARSNILAIFDIGVDQGRPYAPMARTGLPRPLLLGRHVEQGGSTAWCFAFWCPIPGSLTEAGSTAL